MANPISVAILAGGQSSRMGSNKALVRVGGQPVIERIIERVQPLGEELLLITNTPDVYTHLSLPTYSDVVPGKGPLGGLYTAIVKAHHEHTLAVSCDQPFLNPALLQSLVDLRHTFDVVVPLAQDGYPQSMHAIYGKGCADAIRRCLDADRLKMIAFFAEVRVREVSGEAIDRIDPERLSFFNLNTPEDLQQAERIATRLKGRNPQ